MDPDSIADQILGQVLQGTGAQELLNSRSDFRNKELQQRWDIAQLGERGASERARIGASASTRNAQIAASASTKNAKLAAETQRYGIDTTAQTARERLGLDTELGRGQLGVARGALGLQALELPTKYRGPQDYFQQSDILRGLSQRQDVPMFIANLLDPMNTNATLGAGTGGSPTGFSIDNTLATLAGGGQMPMGATQGQNATALAKIKQIGQQGLTSLQPGALERLTPSELGALQSGIEYTGNNGPAWDWGDLLAIREQQKYQPGNPFAA